MTLSVAMACGRDITGSGVPRRGVIRINTRSFQTSSGGGAVSDNVVRLRVIVSAISGSPSTSRVIANVTPSMDSLDRNNTQGNNASDTAVVLTVSFPLQGSGVTYEVLLKAVNDNGDTTYSAGPATFGASDVGVAGAVSVTMQAVYIGPGAAATRVVASPRSVLLVANLPSGFSTQLSAQAYDAAGAALPRALYQWGTADSTIARVDGTTGQVFSQAKRGSTKVYVVVAGPARATDSVSVFVTFAPSALQVVSGGGQSGTAGKALANPIVVRAIAPDGVPVGGATVVFSAQGGGSASPATVVTGTNGTAQTTWTLGPNLGGQTLNVQLPNGPGTVINATAR